MTPYGYESFDQMIAQDVFYVAHRGGSVSFPEHTMKAYAGSVAWGAPALEMSFAKTSDGVWIALHDETLNRTSETTGLPPVSEMTWAQVGAHRITVGGSDEPYESAETVLDLYSQSHLFFVDPKHQIGNLSEFFSFLKNFPGWDKMVFKYSYDSGSSAEVARAKGFRTWGYYYGRDAHSIATTSKDWDLIGMDYSAPKQAWDLALDAGKPVIGHVCPTAEAANRALSQGASGLMCSGVTAIVPGR